MKFCQLNSLEILYSYYYQKGRQTPRRRERIIFCCSVKKEGTQMAKTKNRILFYRKKREWFLEDKHPNHYLYPCTWIIAASVCTKAKLIQAYQIQCWLWGWHLGHLLKSPVLCFIFICIYLKFWCTNLFATLPLKRFKFFSEGLKSLWRDNSPAFRRGKSPFPYQTRGRPKRNTNI